MIPRPAEPQGYSRPCTGGALFGGAGAFAGGVGILACADATELSAGAGACPDRFTAPPFGMACSGAVRDCISLGRVRARYLPRSLPFTPQELPIAGPAV